MMLPVAYSLETGPVLIKEWMRYSENFIFLVPIGGDEDIAKLSMPDFFWNSLTIARYLKLGQDATKLPGWTEYNKAF